MGEGGATAGVALEKAGGGEGGDLGGGFGHAVGESQGDVVVAGGVEQIFPGGCTTDEDGFAGGEPGAEGGILERSLQLSWDQGDEEFLWVDGWEVSGLQLFEGGEGKFAAGEERSHELHQAADVVERQHAAGVNAIDLEMRPECRDVGGEGFPGVDDKANLAGGASGGNHDPARLGHWNQPSLNPPLARGGLRGGLLVRGETSPPDIRLHQVEHLPPFSRSPVGIAQENGRSRHAGGHETGQEPFWIGFRQEHYRLSS